MQKIIKVKGIGTAKASPDRIELSISLCAQNSDYQETITISARQHAQLVSILDPLGFAKSDLKTTNFSVDTEYENSQDASGGYIRIFKGYICNHSLRLNFDFSMQMLAKVISYLSRSEADPTFTIHFSVKESETLRAKALMSATANAYKRATVLTQASRTTLGEIINIEYGSSRNQTHSPTSFGHGQRAAMMMDMGNSLDVQPEDVSVEDVVEITWELL